VVHITGGGLPGKLRRILKPSGLGEVIETPFDPPEFMRYTQALGNVRDEEAYRTWKMGQGMVVITPKPEEVMKIAQGHRIESQVIGEVRNNPEIRITNNRAFAGMDGSPKELVY
jgi:phosphoribosylformylglycinamidine cyclo-ligase